jgi:hypothetical protein
MGWNPFKAAKKVVKKIAKPIRKISQKFIPKELRWAAPYLAAATPFMLPAGGFGSGILAGAKGRALLSGLANVAGQAAADPEGDDINLLSTLMAGGTGYLGGEGVADRLRGGIEKGIPYKDTITDTVMRDSPGFWQGAENLGRETLAQGADYISGAAEGLASLGSNPEALFEYDAANKINKLPGLTKFAKDMAPIVISGTGDLTKAMGDQAMRDWEKQVADEEAQIEATTTANEGERASLQMQFMREAGHDEETIQETLELNDLGEYYTPPTESAAQGGIIGLKHGGMLNFGGREMDLRGGGFVPIGRKERADDVPARLSKNEFVMTADAVRGAGGGDVNKGAQRMYNVMNNLEARA